MMRSTLSPAICPASLVACRCASLKYAGVVITASVIVLPGRDDHRRGDRLAQVRLRVPLQLLQDEGADLLRGELLVVDLDVPVGAHLALDRADRPVDVGHRLPLRDLTDQHLAVLGEGNHGRRGSRPLSVCDDRWLAAFENSDDRVGGPEVDAYSTCHVLSLIQSLI